MSENDVEQSGEDDPDAKAPANEPVEQPPAEAPTAGEAAIDPDTSDDDEAVVADPNDRGRRLGLTVLAVVVGLVSLVVPLSASGLWDPYELKVADLARRIAVALLGAERLAIEGAINAVPTTGELGRGELPFTSVAVGLLVFGLNDWAGRIPLAIWGIVGLLSTYALVARLMDRVAAAVSVLVLATMPLFFLHARTILGDIVMMASVSLATAGLAVATFDARCSRRQRVLWIALAASGMAAGFSTRGVLPGIALPALSVGIAWLLCPASARRASAVQGVASLCVGVASFAAGVYALAHASESEFSRLVGSAITPPRQFPTHDFVVHHLGHGLFPWSAVAPFALGRLLRAPPLAPSVAGAAHSGGLPDPSVAGAAHSGGLPGESFERESALRLTLGVTVVLGFGIYAAMVPSVGNIPFGPVFALAAVVAIFFRDFERGAPPSRTIGMGVGALAVLLSTDFKNFPEKGLAAFAVEGATFPESFTATATSIMRYGAIAFAGVFLLAFCERSGEGKPFVRAEYERFVHALRTSFNGNVAFALIFAEVGLVAFAVVNLASRRYFHLRQLETMSVPLKQLAEYGWVALPALALLPLAAMAGRDVMRLALGRLRVTRAAVAMGAVAAFGFVLSVWYYPALAAQISPKDVFESYQRHRRPNEPLAMLGGGSGSATYYAGGDVKTFASAHEAFRWLTEQERQRRWVVVRSRDLAQMNALHRNRTRRNLPVIDGRSSEVLLVSNVLRQGETNENPYAAWVLDERPRPRHRLSINFGGQLEAIGWEVTNTDGTPVDAVRPGKSYDLRLYYEVVKTISGNWKTFLHIDGFQRRYNGDHDTLGGKYPFHLWKVGDFVCDIHTFELDPSFTSGTYQAYFGFFRGEQRLDVQRGAHQDNRVLAGPIVVR